MTAAVCIACGEIKVGAWTPCTACGRDATTDVDRARALLLSDGHLDRRGLADASAAIKAGTPHTFDEGRVHELANAIVNTPAPSNVLLGVFVIGFLAVGTGILVTLAFGVRWLLGLIF